MSATTDRARELAEDFISQQNLAVKLILPLADFIRAELREAYQTGLAHMSANFASALQCERDEAPLDIRAAIALDKETFGGVGRNTKGQAIALMLIDECRAVIRGLEPHAEKDGEETT